jgi:hypothetical protein
LLRAIRYRNRAQSPEGAHILRQEKLYGPLSETMRIHEKPEFDTYRRFLMTLLEAKGHLNSVRGRQLDAEGMVKR